MNLNDFTKLCWNHYLVLVNDFIKISRYVTFDEDNQLCHSIEFLKQYQSICSEIDVVSKLYCEFINPAQKCGNIMDYAHIILSHNQIITSAEVDCDYFKLHPWKDWKCDHNDHKNGGNPNNISPEWWVQYNKVKHSRLKADTSGVPYYKKANLRNTINSLTALYVLEMNIYKELAKSEGIDITTPFDESDFFTYVDWETHIHHQGNGLVMVTTGYVELP